MGFRVTPQRQVILEAIVEAGEHTTFEDIYKRVHALSSSISRATVYRTLELFSKHHLIHVNEIGGNKVYEMASELQHHHLICRRCWGDQKIDDEAFREMSVNLDERYRFLVQSKHLVLIGLCEYCRKEENL